MKTLSSTVAIRPDYVPELVGLYTRALTWQPPQAAIEDFQAALARKAAPPARGIAGIPLHGVILRRPGIIEQMLGATSLEAFMASFRAAMADPEVGTIVLSIDSPGGETSGLAEAAAEIRAARSQKQIVASVESMAASAAYWLAAQASEVVAEPTAILGGIGVYLIHDDVTAALEQAGIKREVIASSELKASYADGSALTDQAREQLQAIVNEQEAMFVGDVAKGRSVTASVVRKDFGGGGILSAGASLKAGMIDRLDTLDGVVRRAVSGRRPTAEAIVPAPEAQIPDPTPDPLPKPAPSPDLELYRRRAAAHSR